MEQCHAGLGGGGGRPELHGCGVHGQEVLSHSTSHDQSPARVSLLLWGSPGESKAAKDPHRIIFQRMFPSKSSWNYYSFNLWAFVITPKDFGNIDSERRLKS